MKHEVDWLRVSQKINEQMKDLHMTRDEVAEAADVSPITVRRIQSGWPAQLDSLLSVGDVLNLTPDYMLGYLDER